MVSAASLKSFGAILGIALAIFFLASAVSAVWSPPTSLPPGNNTDAPLDVGSAPQTKAGNLTIGIGGAGILTASQFNDNILPYALDPSGISVFDFVGIGGIASPSQKLDVAGGIHATGDICTDAAGGACLSTGMVETDPQVGAVTAGNGCVGSSGGIVQCIQSFPPIGALGMHGICVHTTDGVCPAPGEWVESPAYCNAGFCDCSSGGLRKIDHDVLGGGIQKQYFSCI